MTNPDYRHYLLIIDRSGSMLSIKSETENGIQHFVREQAAIPGKATLSLYQFDNLTEIVKDFTTLGEIEGYTLMPRNMTALLDACYIAISQVGSKLELMPEHERPGKISVLIATDGQENFSRMYSQEQVRNLIKQQQDTYSWEFSYIGANVDAFAEAADLGIATASALEFDATSEGTTHAWRSATSANVAYASGTRKGVTYTDEDRKNAKQ